MLFNSKVKIIFLFVFIMSFCDIAYATAPDILLLSPDIYTENQNNVNDYSLNLNAGETFTVSWIVENYGEASNNAEIRYYFSSNSSITLLDQLVATDHINVGAASGGNMWVGGTSKNLNAPVNPGKYHVGACGEIPSGFSCQYAGDITVSIPVEDLINIVPILGLLFSDADN